jgi:two-component system response regulator HydG
VAVDCGALSDNLIEAELFGSVKGAFTGAHNRRRGLVESAAKGTFYLDEIGELSLGAQTRLLRLLEQGTYRPVGSEEECRSDIRVVAATWRPLNAWIEQGLFRLDLYHRLSVIEMSLLPLKDRPEDIGGLVSHFLDKISSERDCTRPKFNDDLTRWFLTYGWPGNVRELRNLLQYFCALFPGRLVGRIHLPARFRVERPGELNPVGKVRTDLPYIEARRQYLDRFQRQYVTAILEEHDGNVSRAATAAGMDRRSIQRILKRSRFQSH